MHQSLFSSYLDSDDYDVLHRHSVLHLLQLIDHANLQLLLVISLLVFLFSLNFYVIFLAVKPQDLSSALSELSKTLSDSAILISIAAGKTTQFIESQLKTKNPVIRVMPNTPAQIGKGVSAISPGANASGADLSLAKNLLSNSGLVVEVSESDQDAVTALSGSGPAYFFSFVEAMINAGVKLGLTNEIATQLAIGTISGSAAMLKESGLDATTLRKNVTSPNGTTAAALSVFTDKDLEKIVFDAMTAAKKRAQELA
jgi:pyrroline-5-carboxylate reductase